MMRRNFHTWRHDNLLLLLSPPGIQISRGHVVDSAGVSRVLLLERTSHLSCCYPPSAPKTLLSPSLLSLTLTEGHTLLSCPALSFLSTALSLRLPLPLLPSFPSSLLLCSNFSLYSCSNAWVSMFSEPLWEVRGQWGFRVLHYQFSLKGLQVLGLNI